MRHALLTVYLAALIFVGTKVSRGEDVCTAYSDSCQNCTAQFECVWAIRVKDYTLTCTLGTTAELIRNVSARPNQCSNEVSCTKHLFTNITFFSFFLNALTADRQTCESDRHRRMERRKDA